MKPTIGRIVIIHQPEGEQLAAIITQVISDTEIKATGFIPNGNTSPFGPLSQRTTNPVYATCWDWPERV